MASARQLRASSPPDQALSGGFERKAEAAPRDAETRSGNEFRLGYAEADDGDRTRDPQLGKQGFPKPLL